MKLVIFDFDGVLADTLLICHSINIETHSDLTLEEYKSFFKGNISDARRHDGTQMNFRPDFFEHYAERTRELKVPEAMKEIIKKLSSNFVLAIVSSTTSPLIRDILGREGIAKYFSDILGFDVASSKIAKNKTLLAKYKVDPEEAVFVTDTIGDIIEARKCGIKSIAVTWGFHSGKELEKENPAKIVSTPEDLLKAIKETLNSN